VRPSGTCRRQRGATLVVGLIMLVLITLMMAGTFTLSTSNVKSVGNMQFRNEAIASANQAIEGALGLAFMPTQPVPIDVNRDGYPDHAVQLFRTCVSAALIPGTAVGGAGCSVTLPCPAAQQEYMVVWDYDANVIDAATGTSVRVRQGIRQRLNQAQCDQLCPPAPGTPCS
jgi:hypothetical protein